LRTLNRRRSLLHISVHTIGSVLISILFDWCRH
jgi:hypothetical protein